MRMFKRGDSIRLKRYNDGTQLIGLDRDIYERFYAHTTLKVTRVAGNLTGFGGDGILRYELNDDWWFHYENVLPLIKTIKY